MNTTETSQRPPWGIALLIASVTALALVAGGILFYQHEKARIAAKHYDLIRSVAALKVGQIVAWREERLRDAKRNASDPFIRQMVTELLLHPADAILRAKVQQHLQLIKTQESCQDVIITGADGLVLLSASLPKPLAMADRITVLAHRAMASAQPVFGELVSCQTCSQVGLDVAIAMAGDHDSPMAVLILRTDVRKSLYPLLQTWPIPSPSAETVLVRREAENVLALSPNRDQSAPPLGTLIPLTRIEPPLVQAALGTRGFFYGRDYHGVEVMADIQAVPGSPWLIVAKVDQSEILAEAGEHGWFIAGLAMLGLLTTFAMPTLLLNYRQRRLYHSLYLAGQEQLLADAAQRQNAIHLAKLNRVYAMLKAVGQAIIRERTPQALFAEACRMAVEEGKFRMAWVGVLDEQTRRILAVADAGVSEDYLEHLGIVLDESPRGQGPTGLAFRSGEAVAINDIERDPSMGPWREHAMRLGYRASASLPMTVAGRVVAILNLYSDESGFFDQEETQLLAEMIGDMSFALEFMEQGKRRQAAEGELHKFFRAMEQSPVSMIITDTQGVIEYVNPKFLRVTGYGLAEVLGKNPRILKSGETSPEEYRKLWQTITAGAEWHGEFHNRKKDGTFFWERAAISPIRNEAGQVSNFLAIKEDITLQKSLEEQLAQAQKMETVGRLAGGVAHDFNNMLAVILGSTELALDQVPLGDPLRVDLEEIRSAARRSAGLTRQLLAFARKQIAVPQVLELNSAIESMLTMLRRLLGEDVSLLWRPGQGLWPVKIDPSQIDQILANLTVNARDALDRNGVLTVETANVVLDDTYCRSNPECRPGGYGQCNPESCSGDYVLLTVSDTGAGMDQDTLAHIFEPFYTTKGVGQGTGLGLSTIYGIVKQNGGHIVADSEPGEGTTFRIYLPRVGEAAAAARPQEVPEQQEPPPGNETVLLVEDEGAILQLGERILRQYGYTVLTASRPEDGLALAAAHPGPLHLLITDIVMPGMDGKELARQLVVLRPGVKVLLMSGYTADVIACHGVLEPDIPFIEKPFSKTELLDKVRQALDA
jgi:PAS domain S-box-containing protein